MSDIDKEAGPLLVRLTGDLEFGKYEGLTATNQLRWNADGELEQMWQGIVTGKAEWQLVPRVEEADNQGTARTTSRA